LPDGACIAIDGSWQFEQLNTGLVDTNSAALTTTRAASEYVQSENIDDAIGKSVLKLSSSLAVHPGQLIIVCGPPGAGKSALLLSLLGELTPTQHACESHSTNGSNDNSRSSNSSVDITSSSCRTSRRRRILNEVTNLCYGPQDAFIFNGTLKDNVLFFQLSRNALNTSGVSGTAHAQLTDSDQSAYDAALASAALNADLPYLPNGEYTMIGSKGWQLSQSQKQRVALARAIFGARHGAPRQQRPPDPPSTDPQTTIDNVSKSTTAAPLSSGLQSALAGAWSNATFSGSGADSNIEVSSDASSDGRSTRPSKHLRLSRRAPSMAPLLEVDERPSDMSDSQRESMSIDDGNDKKMAGNESAVLRNSTPKAMTMMLLDDPMLAMDEDEAQNLWQKAIKPLVQPPFQGISPSADASPLLDTRSTSLHASPEGTCAVVLATSRLDVIMADSACVHEVLASQNEYFP